jgi:SecD/SecF fusion protein
MLRSKSYLFLLLVLGLGIAAGILYSLTHYSYGLDVKGGIRLTYQMQLNAEERSKAQELRVRLIKVLQQRASGTMGVAEPVIAAKGDDQIIVELPGATDLEKARAIIGTSAKIQFYHAKNVTTGRNQYRPYTAIDSKDENNPSVSFQKTIGGDSKPITYLGPDGKQNPEYQNIIKGWDLILEGEDLASAEMEPKGNGYEPLMKFSPSGADKMANWSRKYYNQGENIASVLDGKVLSIAGLHDNTILRDNAVITGTFPTPWVRNLVDLLNGGSLPVTLTEQSSEKVDPTIGQYALPKMVTAGMIAFGIMAVFLIGYYAFPGVVALVALMLYVLFTLTMLKLMGATFSLASISGFILSVGMAVDANILVFERLKEEMKSGKSLMTAIELGFKRAFPAIVDSNACTILTSMVLLALGTGPVKGFATTLIIGVVISLFTAVTVTRSLLVFCAGSGFATNPKWYAANRSWFGSKFEQKATESPFRIVESAKKWFIISAATMLIAIPFFFMGGFRLNVEFQGGYEAVYPMPAGLTSQGILATLEEHGFKGGNVQQGSAAGGQKRVYITLPPDKRIESAPDKLKIIADNAGITTYTLNDTSFTSIGPAVQQETIRNAGIAVVISSLLILVYLAFRFGIGFGGFRAGLRFGGSAIGALLHDIIVVIGTAAIFGYILNWEISALFLTAMLTVIGFSVHDTIVIFDRIRENLHRQRQSEEFGHLIDRSITQSFARSINTSATVIATLAILLFAGTTTPELKFFVLAMLVGIISGTYSSIYNASPILYLWDKAVAKKDPEHALMRMATKDLAKQRILGTTAEPTAPVVSPESGRTYGQVKRRASSQNKGHIEIED